MTGAKVTLNGQTGKGSVTLPDRGTGGVRASVEVDVLDVLDLHHTSAAVLVLAGRACRECGAPTTGEGPS